MQRNEYGNVAVGEVPADCVHVRGLRLQPLCRKLGIEYAECVVGFTREYRGHRYPEFDGVVIYRRDEPALQRAIRERTKRVRSREKGSRKKRLAEICYWRQFTPSQRKTIKTNSYPCIAGKIFARRPSCPEEFGFWSSLTSEDRTGWSVYADWLQERDFTEDEAKVRKGIEALSRVLDFKSRVSESDLSDDWKEYLIQHAKRFAAEGRDALFIACARVLKNPQQAHPDWLVRAVSGLAKARVTPKNYDEIRACVKPVVRVVRCWSCGERGHMAHECYDRR